jgi:hypothetical protein
MSGFVCPHCGERSEVFAPVVQARSVWELGVVRLGTVPLDPRLASAPAERAAAFEPIAARLLDALERRSAA